MGGKLIFWETIIHYGGSDDIIASGRMKQDRQAGQDRTGLESGETRDTGQQRGGIAAHHVRVVIFLGLLFRSSSSSSVELISSSKSSIGASIVIIVLY